MTETETELGKVISFPLADETPPRSNINFEVIDTGCCVRHIGYTVNEKERTVTCRRCGALVDPFDALMLVANRETQLADNVQALRLEERERRQRIDKLNTIERNAKARIKRAEKNKND